MNVGAILDFVAGKLDAQVLAYMQEYATPPSLMDKVLDRIQSHMRQMKSEEYAEELTNVQLQMALSGTEQAGAETPPPDEDDPSSGTETDTIEGFKGKMGMKGEKNADVQRKSGQPGKGNTAV